MFFPTLFQRWWPWLLRWALGVLLPLAVVGFIAEDVLEQERYAFEAPLLLAIHQNASRGLTQLSLWLHRVGEPSSMAAVFVLIPAVLLLLGRRGRALFAFGGLGTAVLSMWIMKLLFDRPRPELWPHLVQEHGASFPSGHSTAAAALSTCLVLLLPRPWRWPAALLGLTYTLLMGFSRLVLGVHYPSDVLAGWLTGLSCVLGAYHLYQHQARLNSARNAASKSAVNPYP